MREKAKIISLNLILILILQIILPIFTNIEISKVEAAGTMHWVFAYTGASQEFVVPESGLYSLECWGAQGNKGGVGGYSYIQVNLKKGDILYANVGGTNGYNGGGIRGADTTGQYPRYGFNGGGGTDFRVIQGDYNSRIIAACGGRRWRI